MIIGIPKESLKGENRVAASPSSVKALIKLGFDVVIEKGAGKKASFNDGDYEQQGAQLVSSDQAWQAELVYKVNAPTEEEIALLNEGSTLVSFIFSCAKP